MGQFMGEFDRLIFMGEFDRLIFVGEFDRLAFMGEFDRLAFMGEFDRLIGGVGVDNGGLGNSRNNEAKNGVDGKIGCLALGGTGGRINLLYATNVGICIILS
jgi:hypothetical protein